MEASIIQGALLGLAVGDALGVPVEFTSQISLLKKPVADMRGFGTHNQPAGTWSDDSSMTFCLAESIANGFELNDLASRFIQWYQSGYWTPHGTVFDIGITTRKALANIQRGESLETAGLADEFSNGNGSLMRILPIVFLISEKSLAERITYIRKISALTHRHIRSIAACTFYIEYARLLLAGYNKLEAYRELQTEAMVIIELLALPKTEIAHFSQFLDQDLSQLDSSCIRGSGYVIHSLEASIWSLLTTNSYKEAVLKAVNLGEDTDTTGAITGGLAGLYYKLDSIPIQWVNVLAKKNLIFDLAHRLQTAIAAVD